MNPNTSNLAAAVVAGMITIAPTMPSYSYDGPVIKQAPTQSCAIGWYPTITRKPHRMCGTNDLGMVQIGVFECGKATGYGGGCVDHCVFKYCEN